MTETKTKPRILELDIIRGLALYGILLVNIFLFNAPYLHFHEFYGQFSVFQLKIIEIIHSLCGNKMMPLYALLFGISAYLLSLKSNSLLEFNNYFLKRMIILLGFGLLHLFLLWSGDILIPYSIIGIILIFLCRLNNKILFVIGIILYFSEMIFRMGSEYFQIFNIRVDNVIPYQRFIDVYAGSNYMAILKLRVNEYFQFRNEKLLIYVPKEMAFIIFGYLSARSQFVFKFISSEYSRKILNYIKLSVLGSICLVIGMYILKYKLNEIILQTQFYILVKYFISAIINLIQPLTYFILIIIILKSKLFYKILNITHYPGKMPLSNYLFQSLVCTLIFYGYGLGLYASLKPTQLILLATCIYIFQVFFSCIWINRFGMGILERLWRKLSDKLII